MLQLHTYKYSLAELPPSSTADAWIVQGEEWKLLSGGWMEIKKQKEKEQ